MEQNYQTPFRSQISAVQKKMQMLKLREYIYNYLVQHGGLSMEQAYQIANEYPNHRIRETEGFCDRDLNYVNGRLEEIEKLHLEIDNILV